MTNLPDIQQGLPEVYEYIPPSKTDSLDNSKLPDVSCQSELQFDSISTVSQSKSQFENKQNVKKSRSGVVYSDESRIQRIARLELELYELQNSIQEESQESKSHSLVLKKMDDLQGILGGLMLIKDYEMNENSKALESLILQEKSDLNLLHKQNAPNSLNEETRNDKWIDLEKRISDLESRLGTSLYELHAQPPITSHLQEMQSQLNILADPSYMEHVIKRLQMFHDSKQKDTNNDLLIEIQKTLASPLLPMVPKVLDRLETLKSVHDSAIHMEKWMNITSERVEKGNKDLMDLKRNIQMLEETVKDNCRVMTENVEFLKSKLNDL